MAFFNTIHEKNRTFRTITDKTSISKSAWKFKESLLGCLLLDIFHQPWLQQMQDMDSLCFLFGSHGLTAKSVHCASGMKGRSPLTLAVSTKPEPRNKNGASSAHSCSCTAQGHTLAQLTLKWDLESKADGCFYTYSCCGQRLGISWTMSL